MLALLKKNRKLLGFVTFGGLAGLTYAVILVISVDILRIPTFISSMIAFALAIPVSYFGNRWVTYRSKNVLASEAIRFIIVQGINLVLTSGIVHFMVKWFALPTYIGVIVAFVAAPAISFILFELWVYRQHQGARLPHKTPSN